MRWPRCVRSIHACQETRQNCPALAERLDTFIDQTDLLSKYFSQLVARRESWIVVPDAGKQALDGFECHPRAAEHLDTPYGFLFGQAIVAIAGVRPLRRKQSFVFVVTQHSDADPRPPGEFAD